MMKKILSLLLALVTVCCLGMPVSAFSLDGDQTFGKSAPYLQITAGTDPDTTYADIAAAKQPQYLIGVYENEALVQEVHIVVRNKRYDYRSGKEDLSAARFIDRYGNDVVFVDYLEERFVVFEDEPDTLYPIEQFLEEDFTTPVPHDYSLNEYVKAAVFLQMQPNLKLEKYRDFTSNGFDDALKEISAAFWPEYSAWEAKRNQNITVCVTIGILLFVCGLAVLLVILGKKGKLKINNDFINKIWVPSLKKWRN